MISEDDVTYHNINGTPVVLNTDNPYVKEVNGGSGQTYTIQVTVEDSTDPQFVNSHL